MKLLQIFKFEFLYQLRRAWIWLAFIAMLLIGFFSARVAFLPVTLQEDFIMNSPFTIAVITIFSSQIWLLLAPVVAGEVGSKDLHSRMFPLSYSTPVTKMEFLGGRFLAAFLLNVLILLAVQIGMLIAFQGPGLDPIILGPFRPQAYLSAFMSIAITNGFIATTFQFIAALFTGRSMASYFGSLILFIFSYPITITLYLTGVDNALLSDPIGILAIMNEMMSNWTIVEKNVRMFTLEGEMLWNRILWIGLSVLALTITYFKFRLAYPKNYLWWSKLKSVFRRKRKIKKTVISPIIELNQSAFINNSIVTDLLRIFSIGKNSLFSIIKSPGGLFLFIAFPLLLTFMISVQNEHWGIPLIPKTSYLLSKHLTGILSSPLNYWVIVPLFIIYFSGELVWRDRDALINEIIDTNPVSDWVLYLGKFFGLCLVLAIFMVIICLVGISVQALEGYQQYELNLYLKVLLGFQLTDYILFAALVFTIQAIVNQKYLGHIVSLFAYLLIVFSSYLGLEHHLLVYASGPVWAYTDLRGWGSTITPWLLFRIYWAGWAILLALLARLFWIRGYNPALKKRWLLAKSRFNRSSVVVGVLSISIVLIIGVVIFYNTNILNDYYSADEITESRAKYEKEYGVYRDVPQPIKVSTNIKVEIYPDQHSATLEGTYILVNQESKPIKEIHIEPAFNVITRIDFDRAFKLKLKDDEVGHSIYNLEKPLLPGEELQLHFEVTLEGKGFTNNGLRNNGAGRAVLEKGTYITEVILPVLGYNPRRELMSADDRREYNLPRQVTLPAPGDIDNDLVATPPSSYHAVVGTEKGQVAVATGKLVNQWTEDDRDYFEFSSEGPVNGTDIYFSADYNVYNENWKGTEISIYLHPKHTEHQDRLLKSLRASLDYFSEQFGEYPYSFLKVVEQPGNFMGMGVDGSGVITGGEGFFLLDPSGDGFDGIFEIVAHEMGHQWWGMQLKHAFAEGAGVITESLAWYSGMQLVKNTKDREALRRFMKIMREPNPWPPMRTGLPLLRSMDPYSNYRKGPFAMYALSEYVGETEINKALKNLIASNKGKLATTLDLYDNLKTVTPDSLKPLLYDLFEVNTFWTFDAKSITAKPIDNQNWEVKLDFESRKVYTDSAGAETVVPVHQWVEVGIFGASKSGNYLGKPLHLEKHFIKNGLQTLKIIVPEKPIKAGIDPFNLLDWREDDNIEVVALPGSENN